MNESEDLKTQAKYLDSLSRYNLVIVSIYKLVDFQFIDFDGQIFTSFCGQKKALGSLINFEDIIFPSGDFCHQNTCINPLDQMIPKKRRSEDLL